jgi:hypothetical protein
MTRRNTGAGVIVLATLFIAGPLSADAIFRTQAMLATTIAEFFIEDNRVVVELEIGLADLPAFRNLLPDEVYERMGYAPAPLAQRLRTFITENLVILNHDGNALAARVLAIGPSERVRRDKISGEPLPVGDDEPETVITARLEYLFDGQPDSLTFGGRWDDATASVGFVVYHLKVPVNDFRYLSQSQVLDLDWNDPWYSSFRTRSLRRTYFSPMSGFIYVEPYEVRKEIVVRPKDLQSWIDLGLSGRQTIPVDMQDELKRTAAAFLREHHTVVIDGENIAPELARINFLDRSLRTSRVIDPPEELDINSAILGAIFVYSIVEPLPQRVTMTWDLFNDKIQLIPAASVDQAGALPVYLEPDYAVLEWQNFLKNPILPTLEVIVAPPSIVARVMLYLRWLLLVATLVVLVRLLYALRRDGPVRGAFYGLAGAALVSAAAFYLGQQAVVSDERGQEIVGGLLHNVYRAFDFRDESKIYDVLQQSVEGDLLTQIYLETRRGLELTSQGGARAKVKSIELTELTTRPSDDAGFVANATWTVAGAVGHWGHLHQRANRYKADMRVQPVNGNWKLTGLEILEEERL